MLRKNRNNGQAMFFEIRGLFEIPVVENKSSVFLPLGYVICHY